ncbi:hypothetical protein DRH13_03040 [Candidatus Woesebacteria bacterium]|nr:MAG: hypothetical protein DRH13_03040 [Candidatus Woesebacteria bacterium]
MNSERKWKWGVGILAVAVIIILIWSFIQNKKTVSMLPTPTEAPMVVDLEEVVEVEYAADYAREVCGEQAVKSFNPVTGVVVCAEQAQYPPIDDDDVSAENGDEDTGPEFGLPGTSTVEEVFRSVDALDYPEIVAPNASRQVIFPDVPREGKPALAAYESPFEDGDYCDNTPCGMDVPQYYYRVMTAGEVTIPKLNVSCVATSTKGCLVIVINHFGPTAMFRGNTIDHGFTIAGRVWNMERPVNVSVVSQALLDHYVYRMSTVPYGANCSTIDACETVEWHLVVIGDGESQAHWSGLFRR